MVNFIKKIFDEDMIKEIIKTALIYFIYILYEGGLFLEDDLINQVKENTVLLLTSVTYLIIVLITKLFVRPINIEVNLINSSTEENNTKLYSQGVEREDTKTIITKLTMSRTGSLWNKVALKFIKTKKLSIEFCVGPEKEKLILQPIICDNNIRITQYGFSIDLNSLIESNLRDNVSFTIPYKFIVQENRDNLIQIEQIFYVKPKILLNDNQLNSIFQKFIRMKGLEEELHSIKFII